MQSPPTGRSQSYRTSNRVRPRSIDRGDDTDDDPVILISHGEPPNIRSRSISTSRPIPSRKSGEPPAFTTMVYPEDRNSRPKSYPAAEDSDRDREAARGSGRVSQDQIRSQALVRREPASRRDDDWMHNHDPYKNFKRIIACLDGTWLDSDNGMMNGKIQIASNVTRIQAAIKPESRDGIQQITFYQKGLGSTGGLVDKVVGGAFGEGLNENVREAYAFIANNYEVGDEIIIIGFSRGAFTARTVAGMISLVGVLTKSGLSYLPEIFKDILHRGDPKYRDKNPDIPFRRKPPADDPAYREELWRRGFTTLDVPIKAVGVWDTVGSLGIPRIGVLQRLGIQGEDSREMSFYDTKLPRLLENAFQALALDENRASFAPAVWEKPPGNKTTLRQVWFPGVHSNIGGGYDDQELANLTLAWMMSQLAPFIDFDQDYIKRQYKSNKNYYREIDDPYRPWGWGMIYNSMTGIYALGGGKSRTPGRYKRVSSNGRTTDQYLSNTHEYIHASARVRIFWSGPGKEDKGDYDPSALKDWQLKVEYAKNSSKPDIFWKSVTRPPSGAAKILPEAPLWAFERHLLNMDSAFEKEVMNPPPRKKSRRYRSPNA